MTMLIRVRNGGEYLYQASYGPEYTLVKGRAYLYSDLGTAQSDAMRFGGCVEVEWESER